MNSRESERFEVSMTGKTTDPRVFISYSWSNPKHEQWVINLAERLCVDGVDAVLDKWDLKEGQDKFHFMEQMVRDPAIHRVLMICDKQYADKADDRKGGVGTESQIISKEMYENVVQEKFIPIVVQVSDEGKPYLPTFVSSRIYLDFSDEAQFETRYERLLRNIYNRPLNKKPTKGVAPAYIAEEDQTPTYKCISVQKQLRAALMTDKQFSLGLLDDLFETVQWHLNEQRLRHTDKPIDESVLASIEELLPVRDCIVDAIIDLCRYKQEFPVEKVRDFLEKLLQFNYRPENVTSWREYDFDVFKFFNYELLLYVLAVLIKKQKYTEAAALMHAQYFYRDGEHRDDDVTVFNQYLRSLEDVYKKRIKSNLITIFGDKVKERARLESVQFSDLMLAESLLYFIMALRGRLYDWYPRTLVYRNHFHTFDFYTRLKSKTHFARVKPLFGVNSESEYRTLVQEAVKRHSEDNYYGSWNERNFPSIQELAHLNVVCTVT